MNSSPPGARDAVAAARDRAQQLAHFLDDRVAGLVSPAVVDVLEVVDVEREQRDVLARARRARELALELLLEPAAVEASAQRIGEHEIRELRAHAVVGASDHRHAVGARLAREIELLAEVALLRALEQRRECGAAGP